MSLEYQTLRLGQLDTNCYLIWDDQTRDCIIIDPADEGDFINSTILQQQLNPVGIWLTHGHLDHILGLLEVKLAWNIPIYGHKADNFLIKSVQKRAQHWFGIDVDPAPIPDIQIKNQDILELGKHEFKVIHTPGHTPGSISFYSKKNRLLISGDTIFYQAIGRSDFSYSKPLQLSDSVRQLLQLPKETIVLSGHGPETTIEDENKFHQS